MSTSNSSVEFDPKFVGEGPTLNNINILEFNWSNTFSNTQDLIEKILKAVDYLHGIGFVHRDLCEPARYLFSQENGTVSVRFQKVDCIPVGASHHSKDTNMMDLACFFSRFFCGDTALPGNVFGYSSDDGPMRFVPQIDGKSAYVEEVKDFIEKMSRGLKYDPRDPKSTYEASPSAGELLLRPLLWNPKNKLLFLQNKGEALNNIVNQHPKHPLIAAINKIESFDVEVGPDWCFVEDGIVSALKGLKVEKGEKNRDPTRIEHLLGGVNSASSFLIKVRNLIVHRILVYPTMRLPVVQNVPNEVNGVPTLFEPPTGDFGGIEFLQDIDVDIEKAFDIYLSVTVPSFFMGVHSAFYEPKKGPSWDSDDGLESDDGS